MRALSLSSLAALALVAVSCDTTPVEPPRVEAEAAVPPFKANQVWVESSFFADNVTPAPCLGEDLRFYGEVPYRWHRVWNSAGRYSDFLYLEPSTSQLPFLAEGMLSGIVWEARGATDPAMYRAGPGEVIHAIIRENYISNDGPNFRATGAEHLTINANGDVTVSGAFTFEIVCTGQG
jgi:hypothetical protein